MSRGLAKKLLFALFLTCIIFLVAYLAHRPSPSIPTPTLTPTQTVTSIPPTNTLLPPTPTHTLAPPTPTPNSFPVFYTVQVGDTLESIARKFGLSVEDLALANHISNINLIYAGEQLLISTAPVTTPTPTILHSKQIITVLSTQRTYAFEDGQLLREFIIASGIAAYPTVTGSYEIYLKYESTRMTGPGYDILSVPWTMYFYQGYGFHGAPWNHNLGTPGSHGCINMSVEDAEWLFNWAPLGTPVLILP